MTRQIILMADVVGSRGEKSMQIFEALNLLVEASNAKHRQNLYSPLTITLGDEFQGVVSTLCAALQLTYDMEDMILEHGLSLRLRYVINYGEIDTEINPRIAHNMLGPGLTSARERLVTKRRDRRRIHITTDNSRLDEDLNEILYVAFSLSNRWKLKDYKLVHMIFSKPVSVVAKIFSKDPSQIYRRRHTLLVKEYSKLRNVGLRLSRDWDAVNQSVLWDSNDDNCHQMKKAA